MKDTVNALALILSRLSSRKATMALALLALSTLNPQLSTVFAQGTAFTYQGRLNNNGAPANGSYDFRFRLATDSYGNNYVDGPVLINGLAVNNGLFLATLDYGSVFAGSNYWLEVDVKTNGAGAYSALSPLLPLTPAPYAIMANSASNLLGPLPATQLSAGTASISISGNAATATTANNFSGSLAGDVTGPQSATVVGRVGGVSAANVASGANAANAATGADTASTIVQRDGSGSLSAKNITLDGNLNLPATTATAGIIYAGGSSLVQSYGTGNFFAGPGAGNLATSGSYNSGFGANALFHDTTGNNNTASGYAALGNNTIGSFNTANGYEALQNNISGLYNTASGWAALQNNTNGGGNAASGALALQHNTFGSYNTASGFYALQNNNASGNTANGFEALLNNTNGSYNTAAGGRALYYNTSGSYNTVSGAWALYSNTSGSYNVALGYQAGQNLTTGNNNIMIGNQGLAGESGVIRIGTAGVHTSTVLAGTTTVNILQILGGADVAEPFIISTKEIPKGAVVVIDDENPGLLKMSDRSYDKRVAGIVSGANGINPGLTLQQPGVTEAGKNVALTGRVYALADACSGSIKPGDLLTTSDTPGHCMKVGDPAKGQGAIIGKAISALQAGKGMVLVLVSLQ